MINVKDLSKLQVGDSVMRYLSSARLPMPATVLAIEDGVIKIGATDAPHPDLFWTFDQATGAEIDEDLGWGPTTGTGSILELPPIGGDVDA